MLGRGQVKKMYETEQSLYDYAIRSLTRKMRTIAELKRLLRQHTLPDTNGEDLISSVVNRLKGQNYLSDENYAAIYARTRKEMNRFGKNRIALDLKTKGVYGAIIQKEVATVFQGSNEISEVEAFLKKKHILFFKNQKEKARLYRMLIRAGFSSRSIFQVLQGLEKA